MKILLFGKNGQVGHELQRSLAPLGQLIALGRSDADFSKPDSLAKIVREQAPDLIVNAAAYTAVDRAESEAGLARTINADAPAILAQEARKLDAWLVHYSTDYVFDGSGETPWRENDAPQPLNIYGRTKWEGEQAIQSSGCKHLIFRTSWVYGIYGQNFIKTILRLAQERDELKIVSDQWGAPTDATLIADITVAALTKAVKDPGLSGLYHLAPQGETNWCDYAKFIAKTAIQQGMQLKAAPDNILPIAARDYKTAAGRPLNSRLDTSKLRQAFAVDLPHWQTGVETTIKAIIGSGN